MADRGEDSLATRIWSEGRRGDMYAVEFSIGNEERIRTMMVHYDRHSDKGEVALYIISEVERRLTALGHKNPEVKLYMAYRGNG